MTQFLVLVMLGAAVACAPRDSASTTDSSPARLSERAGAVADSAPPMDTLLHRFQRGLLQPLALAHTASSHEELTRRFLRALASWDTAALRDLHITKAEYAYLYFPESRMMAPPYDLDPEVAWMLHASESNKGISGVLHRYGGRTLTFEAVECSGEPLRDGASTVWRACMVSVRENETRRTLPLFAATIEREGSVKIFSFASPL